MKHEYVQKMYDLIEMFGEQTLLIEFLSYSSGEELKEFVEHFERHYEVEV